MAGIYGCVVCRRGSAVLHRLLTVLRPYGALLPLPLRVIARNEANRRLASLKSQIRRSQCRAFRRSQSRTSTSRGFYYGRKCTEKMVYGGLLQSVFLHQLAEFFVGDAFPLRFVIYGNERHICAIGLYEDSVGDDSCTTAFAFGF